MHKLCRIQNKKKKREITDFFCKYYPVCTCSKKTFLCFNETYCSICCKLKTLAVTTK